MLFREHRGSLEDSMATAIPLANDKTSLVSHINSLNVFLDNRVISEEMVTVKPYGFDKRIQWDSHIVSISGYGVIGYTNAMPT